MDYPTRLNSFAREFPFPWSVQPDDIHEISAGYERCETSVQQSLVDFEAFLEQFRQRVDLEGTPTVADNA